MSYLRCIICILLCCLRTNVSLAQSFQENKPGIPLMSAQVIREDSLKSLLNQTTNPHKRIDLLLNLKDISEGNGIETQYTNTPAVMRSNRCAGVMSGSPSRSRNRISAAENCQWIFNVCFLV